FQAEHGIRDFHVTGVQTCALPISRGSRPDGERVTLQFVDVVEGVAHGVIEPGNDVRAGGLTEGTQLTDDFEASDGLAELLELDRSEQRRVGNERRSRWAACRRQNR